MTIRNLRILMLAYAALVGVTVGVVHQLLPAADTPFWQDLVLALVSGVLTVIGMVWAAYVASHVATQQYEKHRKRNHGNK